MTTTVEVTEQQPSGMTKSDALVGGSLLVVIVIVIAAFVWRQKQQK